MRNRNLMLLMATLMLLAGAGVAQADLVTFSGELSDNDEPDISVFDAEINYNFQDWGGGYIGLLTVTLDNLTAAPKAYTISEMFMNVSDDVAVMTFTDKGGFGGAQLIASSNAGGFGTFDYEVDLGGGNTGLTAGNSATFQFFVVGSNLTTEDFFFGFATGGGQDKGDAVAALKFTRGPRDDSVYAIPGESVVPEPSTMLLLGAGLAGMLVRRKLA